MGFRPEAIRSRGGGGAAGRETGGKAGGKAGGEAGGGAGGGAATVLSRAAEAQKRPLSRRGASSVGPVDAPLGYGSSQHENRRSG